MAVDPDAIAQARALCSAAAARRASRRGGPAKGLAGQPPRASPQRTHARTLRSGHAARRVAPAAPAACHAAPPWPRRGSPRAAARVFRARACALLPTQPR
jgi:hypothetical protein